MSELRKVDAISISSEDPWKDDVLDRKKIADYLTPVLASITQPFVIAINAPYGAGKTTFVRAWQKDLEKQGWPSIYYNAWEADASDNPMIAFMGAVRNQLLEAPDKAVAEAAKTEEAPIRKLAKNLFAKEGLALLGKIASRAVIGSELMKEVVELGAETKKDVESTAGKLVGALLDKEAQAQNSVGEFRSYLEGALVRSIPVQGGVRRSLVVFVDELDRCRPPYAIATLEAIKHLFSVNNVVFVIPVDGDYLKSALGAVYSAQLDAASYLRRFIDWSVTLPDPPPQKYAAHLCKLFRLSDLKNFNGRRTWEDPVSLTRPFGYFAHNLKLSLRDQEKAFTHLNLAGRAIGENQSPFADTLGAFAVLYLSHASKLRHAVSNLAAVEEFLNWLDPKMAMIERGHVFGDWTRLRPLMHSWFLDEDNSATIGAEITRQSAARNKQDISDAARETARVRGEYLAQVSHFFIGFRQHFHMLHSSVAAITLQRLDLAGKFSPSR